jgi:hypothetical protein
VFKKFTIPYKPKSMLPQKSGKMGILKKFGDG